MDFEQELKRVADSYASRGYRVTIRPDAMALPSFAKDFKVEILGKRGAESVLVAVKQDRDQLAGDFNLTRYAEVIGGQDGWRFDLATLDSEKPGSNEYDGAEDFSIDDIEKSFADARNLHDQGFLSQAVITAWAGFEASMRHRLRAMGERAGWGSSPISMLNELFSNGILDGDDFNRLRNLSRVRNQIVHGFLSPLASEGGAVEFLAEIGLRLVHDSRNVNPANS
ncbi:hypothetical protein [Singulisphaera sp. PoT]|uniref:hypothetical protein n=1 Tax=Singulisphaera sp. PoT TaxID=3411797 RepID=UPI003BF507F1